MEPEGPAEHRVAVVGALMPFFRDWLTDRYAAASVADIPDPAAVAVAVVGPGPTIGATEMDALPGLEAITVYGVGYDNVDVAEAARRGIVVSHTPDVLDDAVADLTVALVPDVLRGVTAADRFVRSGKWAAGERFPLTREVGRTRVGILGLGRIGSATAERLSALAPTSPITPAPRRTSPGRMPRHQSISPASVMSWSSSRRAETAPDTSSTAMSSTRSARTASSSTSLAARSSTRTRSWRPSPSTGLPAPDSTSSPTNPTFRSGS